MPSSSAEEGAEAFADDPLIVDEQDPDGVGHPGTHRSTRNP